MDMYSSMAEDRSGIAFLQPPVGFSDFESSSAFSFRSWIAIASISLSVRIGGES